jgi:putative ABC transport system permease protein
VAQHESLQQLGKDILIVWGGRTSMQTAETQAGRSIQLEHSDVEELRRKAPLIRLASPELSRTDLVARTERNYGTFSVRGVATEYQYMRTIEVEHGRLLNPGDEAEARDVCVIGSEVNAQLFNSENSVGSEIRIQGRPLMVVGIMAHKELNSTYQGQDHSIILVPYQTMRKLFPDPRPGVSVDRINNIIAMPVSHEAHEAAEKQLRSVLGDKKGFAAEDEDALSIWNTARQGQLIGYLLRTMQVFLGAVGIVTLFLGAVGVVNIMLVSVRERTTEIGLRKSIGARKSDIMLQFFAESLSLTMIAGGIGFLLGWAVCQAINQLPFPEMVFKGMLLAPEVGMLAAGALAFVGIGAGIYPAFVAARLNPIEALRHE